MKNKYLFIGVGLVILIAVLGGGYYLFAHKTSTASEQNAGQSQDAASVQTLPPDAIGLSITASPDKKQVKFTVAKLGEIKTIEYELTYEADSTQEEIAEGADARVQRGITGQATIKPGDDSYTSPWLDLGTCSSGTCRYDSGVDSVDLVLKVTKANGQVYQVEQKMNL